MDYEILKRRVFVKENLGLVLRKLGETGRTTEEDLINTMKWFSKYPNDLVPDPCVRMINDIEYNTEESYSQIKEWIKINLNKKGIKRIIDNNKVSYVINTNEISGLEGLEGPYEMFKDEVMTYLLQKF